MSCPDCNERQEVVDEVFDGHPRYFIRVGNSNLELVGCYTHVNMGINLIREGVRANTPEPGPGPGPGPEREK